MSSIGHQGLGILAACIGLWLSASVDAADIPYARCFAEASERYGIDVRVLIAIAKVESDFKMNAVNVNNDGSRDYGIMQINSSWTNALADLGIDWSEVISSACSNIHVGAWILACNFSSYGVNWRAVGAYNAGYATSADAQRRRLRYASQVYRVAQTLQNRAAADPSSESETANSRFRFQ